MYVGRTKQPLQSRIRGHLFKKPMHRSIAIDQVSKIEYVELKTEADMNLYEIYYILTLHPPLNVDDKTKDDLTFSLPELEWKEFVPRLWDKWKSDLQVKSTEREKLLRRYKEFPQEISILRSAKKCGEIDEEEYYRRKESLLSEQEDISKKLWR